MKRVLDVVLASSLLALSAPPLALAALAVKLGDGGRVLYRQRRVGRGGDEFELLKLRTMVVGAERLALQPGVRVQHLGRRAAETHRDRVDELRRPQRPSAGR